MNQSLFLRPTRVPLRDKTYKPKDGAKKEWKTKKRTSEPMYSHKSPSPSLPNVKNSSSTMLVKGQTRQLRQMIKYVAC